MRPILVNLSRNLIPFFPDFRAVFTPCIMMELGKPSAIGRRSITIGGTKYYPWEITEIPDSKN